jgi:hypothetical protein
LEGSIKRVQGDNDTLGGKPEPTIDEIPTLTGGWVGAAITERDDYAKQAMGYAHDAASQIPGEIAGTDLDAARLVKERDEWKPGGQYNPGKGPTGTKDTTADTGPLADLFKQQLEQTQAAFRLQSAQFDVFKGFAPLLGMRMIGAFQHGGIVPETGMALVHKGETITPDPAGPYSRPPLGGELNVTVTLAGDGPITEHMVRTARVEADSAAARVKVRTERTARLMSAVGRR